MRISYIAHASLLFETDEAKVVTDPWYIGSAYFNQWYVFPKPLNIDFVNDITHVVLTHGHEDHFHVQTLKTINKQASIYYPYVWKSGAVKTLKKIGFKDINEVASFNTVVLGEDFTATYVISGLDAFTIFEYQGVVILNLNDSLNALHKNYIYLFSEIICKKWPVIDYMICGLGGAGYFPNTVHSNSKNDYEIAGLREQFLAHKFCELVQAIEPKNVIPFVPGFALLENDKQWINKVKFSRNKLQNYYKENFDKKSHINFINMLPGDYIEQETWVKASVYHNRTKDDNLSHLLYEQYSSEIKIANNITFQPASIINQLCIGLNSILKISSAGINLELLQKIDFAIVLTDIKLERYIHLFFENGKITAMPVDSLPSNVVLKISTQSHKLAYALKEEWGGDVFFIGYGADIDIINETCLKDNLDILSLRLLSRFPSASYQMKREPLRAIRYLAGNFEFATLALRQKLISGGNPNKIPYNERSHWINKSKCDVCRLCDIPLLSDELAETLVLA